MLTLTSQPSLTQLPSSTGPQCHGSGLTGVEGEGRGWVGRAGPPARRPVHSAVGACGAQRRWASLLPTGRRTRASCGLCPRLSSGLWPGGVLGPWAEASLLSDDPKVGPGPSATCTGATVRVWAAPLGLFTSLSKKTDPLPPGWRPACPRSRPSQAEEAKPLWTWSAPHLLLGGLTLLGADLSGRGGPRQWSGLLASPSPVLQAYNTWRGACWGWPSDLQAGSGLASPPGPSWVTSWGRGLL